MYIYIPIFQLIRKDIALSLPTCSFEVPLPRRPWHCSQQRAVLDLGSVRCDLFQQPPARLKDAHAEATKAKISLQSDFGPRVSEAKICVSSADDNHVVNFLCCLKVFAAQIK